MSECTIYRSAAHGRLMPSRRARIVRAMALAAIFMAVGLCGARGQGLYFSTQREVTPPDYATFRMGPFYSTMALTESIGYRYTRSSGTGTDYLTENDRGEITEDGSEIPILSALTFRNYLVISRRMDLDMSVRIGYYYYPLDTQEEEFVFDMAEEGIYGTVSTAFRLTDHIEGTIFDNMSYRTDYIDTRGLDDRYGGSDYEHFANRLGAQMNWDMARNYRSVFGLNRYDVQPADDEFEDQERYEYNESASFSYQVRRDLAVGLRANFSQAYYASTNRSDTRQQDYDVFLTYGRGGEEAAGLTLTRRSTLRLSVGTSVGYSAGAGSSSQTTGADDDADADDDDGTTETWDDGSVRLTGRAELETLMTRTVTQTLQYQRGLRSGFSSAFEEYDRASYELKWNGDLTSVKARSAIDSVSPSLAEDTDYRDWINSLSVSWRATPTITLDGATVYTIRDNDSEDVDVEDEEVDIEDFEDYETWSSRIGTSFKIAREITLSMSYRHVERFSDTADLAYSRDTFQALLTYRHQF